MKINLDKYRKRADLRHGNSQRGQYLFWSNCALRAMPSSHLQKAFQAEAAKYRAGFEKSDRYFIDCEGERITGKH